MALDVPDRKILYALLRNARQPVSLLAKQTGLTRDVVQYRMRKLEEAGVIRGYIARIDMSYFSEGVATLLCKLARPTQAQYAAIIAGLQKHPAVNWFAQLCGTADFAITLLYRNAVHLAECVSGITALFGNNLQEHQLSLFITEYKFDRKGVVHGKEEPFKPGLMMHYSGKQDIALDGVDKAILAVLAVDCRASNVAIAKKARVSEDTVRLRIQRLEKEQVLFGYTTVLDVAALGYEAYYIRLQLDQLDEKMISKVIYSVHTNPFVGHCARTAGKFNLVLSLYAKDRRHFTGLLMGIRNHFGDSLLDYEFQMNLGEYKEVYLPEGLR